MNNNKILKYSRKIENKYIKKKTKKNTNYTKLDENLNELFKIHLSLLNSTNLELDNNKIAEHFDNLENSLKQENITTIDKIYLLEHLNSILNFSIEYKKNIEEIN